MAIYPENVTQWTLFAAKLAAVGVLLLAGSAGTIVAAGAAGAYVVSHVPPSWEKAALAPLLRAAAPEEADPDATAILRRLVGGRADDFEVVVWCRGAPNAFAVPGNRIVVTGELLRLLRTEQGLAFVLGHEFGHFEHRHHLTRLGRRLGHAVLASVTGIGPAGPLSLSGFGYALIDARFDRDQERKADATGLDLMEKAYGSVAGAGEFFEGMTREGEILESRPLPLPSAFESHPPTEERSAAVTARNRSGGAPLTPLPQGLRRCESDEGGAGSRLKRRERTP